jgi:hypothetical protein
MLVSNLLFKVQAYIMPDFLLGFKVFVSILKTSKVKSSFGKSLEVMDMDSKLKIVNGRN